MGKLPWFIKILAKLILARLPLDYSFWRRLHIFQHGYMKDASYALDVFLYHFERVKEIRESEKFVALELGPGDSVASAIIAASYGAEKVYLIDTGEYATKDIKIYQDIVKLLKEKGKSAPDIEDCSDIKDILARCNASYLTKGIVSLQSLPNNCVDFIWSQAVFEHIRKKDFFETLVELRRILSEDGVMSHRVDLKDHLGAALNNLRFPEKIWESNIMANSGFYTNRIGYTGMFQVFEDAGFRAELVKVDRWDELPTPRNKLAKEFCGRTDEELKVSGFDVVLRPV